MVKMSKLPKLKKKITSFLIKEDGKINKENLIKTGSMVAIIALGATIGAKPVSSHASCNPDCSGVDNPPNVVNRNIACGAGHGNGLTLGYVQPTATGTHNHCIQSCHCNHTSHASHGSHSSNGHPW